MKRTVRIKALLLVAILWIVGIFVAQLYSLPQIREQVAAGLRTGLQEISRDIASQLSGYFEKELKSELLRLKPSEAFEPESEQLSKLGQKWADLVPQSKISNLWALAVPDSTTQIWKVRAFIPSDRQVANTWELTAPICSLIKRKIPTIYNHWAEDAEQFWANSIDSTLLLYDKESHFSNTESFACHPIFDPVSKNLKCFVCVEIIQSNNLAPFFNDFFDPYFSKEEKLRKDGIRKEFLQIRIRDESGRIIYRSSILANSKMEAKVPISQVSPYLGIFQLELGFIGKNANGVSTSLYQKNLWILGGVFGVLLLLMGALYYTSLKSQKLDRLKAEFLANMGHELKTPLTAIKLANDTLRLKRAETPKQAALSTEIIHKEAAKLEGLVRNLMEYSRMELKERRYNMEEVELKNWWEFWLTHSQEKLSGQGFSLFSNSLEDYERTIMDKSAIEEVLDILLDNAVKYSLDSKELKVHIETEGNMIKIQVEDQGIGIPQDCQADVFEKFVRIENLDVHDVKGYGLGLSIAKEIVEAHGGRIKLDSVLRKGSAFSVFLPCKAGV